LGNRSALGAALAGLSVLIAGAFLGTVVGNAGDPEKLGSLPTEIATEKRLESIPPLPLSKGIPPLTTTKTPEPVQTVDEATETQPVQTPEPEYVPPADEKMPYVPPPAPDITVGENE